MVRSWTGNGHIDQDPSVASHNALSGPYMLVRVQGGGACAETIGANAAHSRDEIYAQVRGAQVGI